MQGFRAHRLSRATLPAFMAEGVVWGMVAAYMPALKAGIGAPDATFGLVLLCGSLGAVLFMGLAPVVDRLFGAWAMAIPALAMALALQGVSTAPSVVTFAALFFLLGGFSGLHDVVMNARVSAIEGAESAPLMNLNHGWFSVAYAVSALGSGLMREAGTPPETAALVWGVVVLVLSLAMRQPNRAVHANTPAGFVPAPPLGGIVLLGGAIVLVGFLAENATEGWSALHIERTLGGDPAEGATGPAMLGLTMALGRFAGQAAMARLDAATVTLWAALTAAAGALIAAAAPVTWVAYVGFATLGLGVSVIAPMVLAMVGDAVPDDRRTPSIARVAMIGYLGFFFGPPLMGIVAGAAGLRVSFACVAILLASVPILLLALRRVRSA